MTRNKVLAKELEMLFDKHRISKIKLEKIRELLDLDDELVERIPICPPYPTVDPDDFPRPRPNPNPNPCPTTPDPPQIDRVVEIKDKHKAIEKGRLTNRIKKQ